MSQLTTMLTAYMTAQSKQHDGGGTRGGGGAKTRGGKGTQQWTPSDNDLPNDQRSIRRHPDSDNYCYSCGYDLPAKHDSHTCKWKKRRSQGCRHHSTTHGRLRTQFLPLPKQMTAWEERQPE
jgi:hypothetical protein